MKYYEVALNVRVHTAGSFTYQSEAELAVGTLVLVEIGTKKSPGIIIAKVTKPSFKTKLIVRVIEEQPLPPGLMDLTKWLQTYYMAPSSSVWQTVLPRGLTTKRRETTLKIPSVSRKKPTFKLNSEQIQVLKEIRANPKTTTLLQGITGSGKTAIYIELAKESIKNKKSVIIVVPEIALSSQFVADFIHDFPDILLTHSRLGEAERHKVWLEALYCTKPRVAIGPRSALFMPLKALGLIVIDEAHEPSLKQEQAPRYSALRAANILASAHQAKLVLGTATPNVSDRFLAEKSEALIARLTKPAKLLGKIDVQLIDSRRQQNFTRHRFFSMAMLEAIEKTLKLKQQVLLFHNRRGSAPMSLCERCGWSALCSHCFVPMVLHNDSYELKCHICGRTEKVPSACPNCHHSDIIHKGIGTKMIEEELTKLFPYARIARFDSDNKQPDTLQNQYQVVYDGEVDIIIGTQVVAKGLDLPGLAMVGVIQADSGLALPDFYAEERVFQLLYQVMGRVGRDEKLSTIIIQTHQPESMPIQAALKKDYEAFYNYALAKRKHDRIPPFTHLLKLTCAYASEKSAAAAARNLKTKLDALYVPNVEILGPTPAFYERLGSNYRWQLIIKSPRRTDLITLLNHVPPTKWQSELDPVSLL